MKELVEFDATEQSMGSKEDGYEVFAQAENEESEITEPSETEDLIPTEIEDEDLDDEDEDLDDEDEDLDDEDEDLDDEDEDLDDEDEDIEKNTQQDVSRRVLSFNDFFNKN